MQLGGLKLSILITWKYTESWSLFYEFFHIFIAFYLFLRSSRFHIFAYLTSSLNAESWKMMKLPEYIQLELLIFFSSTRCSILGGHGTLLGLINSFIHVLMYMYYMLSAIPSMQKYLWWKKFLTQAQIVSINSWNCRRTWQTY